MSGKGGGGGSARRRRRGWSRGRRRLCWRLSSRCSGGLIVVRRDLENLIEERLNPRQIGLSHGPFRELEFQRRQITPGIVGVGNQIENDRVFAAVDIDPCYKNLFAIHEIPASASCARGGSPQYRRQSVCNLRGAKAAHGRSRSSLDLPVFVSVLRWNMAPHRAGGQASFLKDQT